MLPFGLVCLDVLRHHPARRALVADVVPAAGPLQNGDGFALVHTEDDAVLGACTAAQRHADARHRARTGRAGTSLRNRDGRRSDLNLVAVGFIHDDAQNVGTRDSGRVVERQVIQADFRRHHGAIAEQGVVAADDAARALVGGRPRQVAVCHARRRAGHLSLIHI